MGISIIKNEERNMEDKIYGINPVVEAISARREIDKILLQDGAKHSKLSKITAMAKERGITYRFVNKKKLDEIAEGGNHQGVIAYVAAHSYAEISGILDYAKERNEDPFIVIAEGLNDPHNLGSIIRTANAAGAHGVIIPKNRSVGLTATVAKVSAGALEYTRVARTANISDAIEKLKKQGVWVAGTALEGSTLHYECDLTGPLAIVIGAEGTGLSRLVREKCDFLLKIPMLGQAESLNAAVATGVLIYEAVRQRMKKVGETK